MQKLQVKHFRQISEATIELRDLMLFIGEQASGKSTIAKLIYFCKSLKQDYLEIITSKGTKDAHGVQKSLITAIQDKFAMYFGYTSRYADDFEIKFYYSEEQEDFVRLYKAKSLQVEFSYGMWDKIYKRTESAIAKIQKHRTLKYATFQLQDKADKALQNSLIDATSSLFYDKRNTLFFPAGRNITVSYPEQFQLLFFGSILSGSTKHGKDINTVDTTLMKEFFSYSKFLVDYYAEETHRLTSNTPFANLVSKKIAYILQGKYKNDSGHERIFYDNSRYVALNLASSGQQEVIRIIQDLLYIMQEKENTSRIIEEPETHLFPKAQEALVQLLVLIANYTGTQFIITTHSPFFLTAFNNLLYYNKVLRENPDTKVELQKHFDTAKLNETPKESLGINPDNFQAYALNASNADYCKSIYDKDVQMIVNNYIDEISETMYGDFDFLYSKI